ncbi:MAG: glycosyltransferase [Actinomycetota bacterium]|nr:glycosyltransferase [Actinomycetota bacterium]
MRILFCSLPHFGHVLPLVPLARACVDVGHEVTFATGGPLLGRLPVRSVQAYPERTLSDAEAEVKRRHPELADVAPEEKWRFGIELFADVEYETLLAGVEPIVAEERPDMVVYEVYSAAAGAAALSHGVLAVSVGVSPWASFFELLHRTVMERHEIEWPNAVLADLYLDTFPPSTWVHDAGELRRHEALRPVAWSPGGSEVPAWLLAKRERARVYVTLGTVVFGYTAAFDAALSALDQHDVDVLVTVGPRGDPAAVLRRSQRVRVERFVDQAQVIPLMDAVVHHGGSGTALVAMAAGLPQVVMPQGADQFDNAKLLTATGAARAFLPGMAPDVLARHIAEALTDKEMKASAVKLAEEIAAMPSPADVAKGFPALSR